MRKKLNALLLFLMSPGLSLGLFCLPCGFLSIASVSVCHGEPSGLVPLSYWRTHKLYSEPDLSQEQTVGLLVDPSYRVIAVDGLGLRNIMNPADAWGKLLILPGVHELEFTASSTNRVKLTANFTSAHTYAIVFGVLATGHGHHFLVDLTATNRVVAMRVASSEWEAENMGVKIRYDDGQEKPLNIDMPNLRLRMKARLYTKDGCLWVGD